MIEAMRRSRVRSGAVSGLALAALIGTGVLIGMEMTLAPGPGRANAQEGEVGGEADAKEGDAPGAPRSGDPRQQLIAQLSAEVEKSPEDFELRFRLANAYHDAGSLHSALQQYNEAVRIDSLKSRAWVNRGAVLRELGRQEDAEQSFRAAIRANPEDALAHVNLGDMLLTRQRYPEALDAYRTALRIDPGSPNAYYSLAISFAESGMYRDAARAWRKSAELAKSRGARADLRNAERALENAKLMDDIVSEAEAQIREREAKKRELEEGGGGEAEEPKGE